VKIAELEAGPLEEWAAEAGMRGADVEVHVLAQRWELRALVDGAAVMDALPIEPAGERPRGRVA
jgi:hypothetical protein